MAAKTSRRFDELTKQFDRDKYRKLTETLTFPEYFERVHNQPRLAYSAYQRLYSMIISGGTYTIERYRKTITKFKFFNDPEIPIFGLEETIESLVKHIKGAANWHGTERRILLLHGPVGSSKSTICRLLKRGLERYSQTDDGAIYTYTWVNLGEIKEDGEVLYPALDIKDEQKCPMNDDPLKLVPLYMRKEIEKRLNQINEESSTTAELKQTLYPIRLMGELNPQCDFYMSELLKRYNGDWGKVVENHIRVHRIVLSESKRVGIGTFQPKDPKNQDATELTGDINYTKLAHYGVDSDPRCIAGDSLVATTKGFNELVSLVPSNLPADTFALVDIGVSSLEDVQPANCTYYGGKKQTYKTTTRLGYSIVSTDQHKLLSMDENGTPTWKKVKDLSPGDYVAMGRGSHAWSQEDVTFPDFNDKTSPKKMNVELAYLFGLRIGGRYTCKDNRFEEASADLSYLLNKGYVVNSGDKIPSYVLRSSKEVVLSCLHGLFDALLYARSANDGFYTSSNVLANQVHTLLLAFGVVSSLVFDSSSNCYRVLVYGENVNNLVKLIPSLKDKLTISVEKCKTKKFNNTNYVWLEVQDVSYVGEQDVYDFSVPDTHAYWANGFISHNSFGFDGEFEIANRGFVEFIEVLKLEKEFLYDLLGVCQERQFKPKKFPQIDVDMVIVGHSVEGSTPIPHEYKGVLDVLSIEEMNGLDVDHLRVFSHNDQTLEVQLTEVASVFSHDFEGEWVKNYQDGDCLVTTPNHSVYNKDNVKFYPGDDTTSEIMTLEIPEHLTKGKPCTQRWLDFFGERKVLAA